MEWFYNLSNTARSIIIIVGLAIIAAILWFGVFSQSEETEEASPAPDVTVPVQEPATATPSPEETEGDDNEEEPAPEPVPIDTMETIEEGTDLPEEEVSAALDVAREGVSEWFHADSRETAEEREARVSPYVEIGSPMWNDPPIDSSEFSPEDTESTLYTLVTIGSVEPIGGTEEDFRALIAATIQMEMTMGSGEDLFAQQFSENHYFHVALRKTEGEWKLYNYED